MKKIFYCLLFIVIAFVTYPQQMVVQKTDGSNLKVDLNTIDKINFIIPCPSTPTVDYGGKTYNTVLIGSQCWFKENLNVGNMVTGYPAMDTTIEKHCYNNDPANCETYGALYMWDEAMKYVTTEGAQGICPDGWHIPTEAEVQTLVTYVENDGNSLKREDQGSDDGQGTNVKGFSALLNGGRYYGDYTGIGANSRQFISKKTTCGSGFNRYTCLYTFEFFAATSNINFGPGAMTVWAMGVRCIMDN